MARYSVKNMEVKMKIVVELETDADLSGEEIERDI
jgi:hypothetical protein